jgi:hypothetical protein
VKRPERMAFIVGAPRCGTTTLARVLAQHPDVCMSRVKEPHFFSRHDLGALDEAELRDSVERNYLDRFFARYAGERLAVEASPTYFYAPERMESILRLWPDAKFIVALRDPLSMVPSLHSRLLVTGDETVKDFAKAWALVEERRQGRSIPRSCIDPNFLRYDQAAAFATHLERFIDAVGEGRCLVVLLDDLAREPWQSYETVCAFLDIEPQPDTDLKPHREHRAARFGWVQRLLCRPPVAVRNVLGGENWQLRDGRQSPRGGLTAAVFRARRQILKWNEVPAKRTALAADLREQIIRHYQPEVNRLSEMIGRDLSHWLSAEGD